MGKFFTGIQTWLAGKKTILGGVLIIAAAGAGVFYGKIDPTTALAIGGVGFGLVGLGDKANRHQAQILIALQAIGQAGVEARSGNLAGAMGLVEGEAKPIGASILDSYVGSIQPPPIASASFHVTADSHGQLVENLRSLGQTLVDAAAPAPAGGAPVSAPSNKAAIA
jgi:hypothetical protein